MCICLFQFKFLSDYTSAIFKAQSLAQLTVELEEWMFGVNESKCRMLTTSLGGARSISALYLFISMTLTVERIFVHVTLDAMLIDQTNNPIHVSQTIARSALRSATLS